MKVNLSKTKTYKIVLIAFIIGIPFLTQSCKEKSSVKNIDQEIMVNVPESQLYVRIRGNVEKPLIINLHGGPGGYSGIDIKLMGPALEDKFLIAYLDQRGCGKSPKCQDISMLTIKQYLQDLDIVIDSLRNRYDKNKVALMGTSWGGMYGFLYLLKNSEKVNAYACIDGKVNSKYQNEFLLDFQKRKVNEILKTDIHDEERLRFQKIAQRLDGIDLNNYENFYEEVNWMLHEVSPKLGFNAYFADTSKIISMDAVLNDSSLLNLMNYSKEEYLQISEKAAIVNQAFLDGPEYNDINIEKDLATIKTPCAVIQGKFDYVVGLGHAELIYNALSSLSSENKELHILPNTGHCPAIESPEKLAEILIDFFGKHTF